MFSDDGKPQHEAEVQFSGSFSNTSDSWMWAWANNSLLENVKEGSNSVRKLGETSNFLNLVAAKWNATEVDGWEMTAILAKQLGALGAYRTPHKKGFIYIVITKLEVI